MESSSSSTIWKLSQDAWAKIKIISNVKNAVVFIDDKAAEILHWSGGAKLFFEAGTDDIRQFSSFEVKSSSIL